MSTTLIIISGIVLFIIITIGYNYNKMKNMPHVPDHSNIKILTAKNFKTQINKGLILVDFWAPWCAPCKMMAPTLNNIAETEDQKVSIGKVNVDKQQQLAQKFHIRNIPTMILFKNGKEVKRFSGVKTKKFLMKEVELFLN